MINYSPSPKTGLRWIGRWYTVTPLIAIALFLLVMGGLLWLLHTNELEREQDKLNQDLGWIQQSMRLQLQINEDRIAGLAREITKGQFNAQQFSVEAAEIMYSNPEVVSLAWLDAQMSTHWVNTPDLDFGPRWRKIGDVLEDPEAIATFRRAQNTRSLVYSELLLATDSRRVVELHVPVFRNDRFAGNVVGVYLLDRLITSTVPREMTERYQLTLVDRQGKALASSSTRQPIRTHVVDHVLVEPLGHGIQLRAYAYRSGSGLLNNALTYLVILLTAIIVWSLWILWGHIRHRIEAEAGRDRLFNLSQDLLCLLDQTGRFLRVNPAFERLLGWSTERGNPPSLLEITHPLDQQKVTDQFIHFEQLNTHETQHTALEIRCLIQPSVNASNESNHPEYRWLSWGISAERLSNQSLSLYAVAHDITQRKHAEVALQAETAFRRAMEDSMLTGMRAFDMKGRVTYVNPAFCRIVGWEEIELLDKIPPFPYWPPTMLAEHEAHMQMVLEGRAPEAGFEVVIQRKDGTLFDARMYVSPLLDDAGQQTGWMTSLTDITEPKRIRRELIAAQERFTTVLEELEAAVSVVSLMHGSSHQPDELLFANGYYRKHFGDQVTGHQQLWESACQIQVTPSTTNEATPAEIYHQPTRKWYEVRQRSIQWVDGRSVQMLIATDITSRKTADEWNRQQQEKLQFTSRLVTMGEMASSLAHELNQPLTAIANYSMGTHARIQAGNLSQQELLDALQKTSRQAERAGGIIRRIRSFVKRSNPNRRPCLVQEILDDALSLAEMEASKRKLTIQTLVAPQLPSVSADPILIEQVLLNLIKNGLEAMETMDALSDRNLLIQINQDGNYVLFEIIDRGHGIADQEYERLFEPFYSTKQEGMGMGLNICRSIVEFHEGRLWAQPNPAGGTIFLFTLPVAHPPMGTSTQTTIRTEETI